jgi:hypothetical protein
MTANSQRKPAVYLLVILPVLVGGGICLVDALLRAYSHVRGISQSAVPMPNGLLIALPAIFVWIPISLLLANLVLYVVSPLRRIAEVYSTQAGGPGFATSQKILLRALAWFCLVCLPLIALGFVV